MCILEEEANGFGTLGLMNVICPGKASIIKQIKVFSGLEQLPKRLNEIDRKLQTTIV